MAVFDLLSEELRVAVTKAGLDEPTPPQREAVPIILAGENVLLIAPTGTGKTESVLLPVLHNFLRKNRREPKRGISMLYITPLRALNRDMLKRLEFWSRQLGFTVEVRHGDTPQSERRRQTIKPPDLLVTTPETLQAILPARRMRRNLSEVRWVIVDEVHNLAGSKRGAQLTVALERLRSLTRKTYQILGLSATVSAPNDVSRFLSGVGQRMEIVEIPLDKKVEYTIEYPYPSEDDHAIAQSLFTSPEAAARLSLISELIDAHTSALVFVNSRSVAEMLGSKLAALKTSVAVHHGSLPREERERTEGKFKAGMIKALVCTSTLELGIDIGSVDLTIQYMSPRQVTSLIQRVGRSGHRLSDESRGSIIAVSPDDVLESAAAIDQAKHSFLEPLTIYQNPLDVMAHQIAGVILDNDGEISRKTVLELLRRTSVYEKLEEKVFSRVVSFMQKLNLLREERSVIRATRRTRPYYYENLSMIPDERRYLVIDLTTNQSVGILGEEFVLLRAQAGLHFICKGRIWEIKSVSDDYRVYVTPVEDPLAAIPGWDGEMLPVPIGLAQKVGATRRLIEQLLTDSTVPKATEALKIRADRFAKRKVIEEISEHLKMSAPLPTDQGILAEFFDRYLIIHSCFGEAVNRTLGFIFEEVLSRENLIRMWWADG
ncbi:MAG: DEAD/DEAH box helicase, partial [Candidatus Bathyarchaeia archaeon]